MQRWIIVASTASPATCPRLRGARTAITKAQGAWTAAAILQARAPAAAKKTVPADFFSSRRSSCLANELGAASQAKAPDHDDRNSDRKDGEKPTDVRWEARGG